MTTRQTETEQLIRRAQARGWIAVPTSDGTVLRHPADVWGPGEGTIGLHRTQSDHRALANARAAMLRAEREARKRQRGRKRSQAARPQPPADETAEQRAARQRRDERRRARLEDEQRERQAAELVSPKNRPSPRLPELPAIEVPVPEPAPAVDAATRYPELAEDFYSGVTGLLAFLSGTRLDDFPPSALAEMDAARKTSVRRTRNQQRSDARYRAQLAAVWGEWEAFDVRDRKQRLKLLFDNHVQRHGPEMMVQEAFKAIDANLTPGWAREALSEWLADLLAGRRFLSAPVPAAFQKRK